MSKTEMGSMMCHTANSVADTLRQEENVREKKDGRGNQWSKVYFGSGAHFKNWLDQVLEIFGEENVEIEAVDSTGLKCFEESGDKAYRIWVRKNQDSA